MKCKELIEHINNTDSGKCMNKAYEFGNHKGIGVYWDKQTDTVELPRSVFEYILSQVPTEEWVRNIHDREICPYCGKERWSK